ncbi:hypothetical protein J6590_019252 [Homalodisca vitripennis]|nr:hypothetical protein J6590_019252 [Homalodisca vitripennis]
MEGLNRYTAYIAELDTQEQRDHALAERIRLRKRGKRNRYRRNVMYANRSGQDTDEDVTETTAEETESGGSGYCGGIESGGSGTYGGSLDETSLSSEHNSNDSLRLKIFFLQLRHQLSSFFCPSSASKEGMFRIIQR